MFSIWRHLEVVEFSVIDAIDDLLSLDLVGADVISSKDLLFDLGAVGEEMNAHDRDVVKLDGGQFGVVFAVDCKQVEITTVT